MEAGVGPVGAAHVLVQLLADRQVAQARALLSQAEGDEAEGETGGQGVRLPVPDQLRFARVRAVCLQHLKKHTIL